MLQPSTTPYVFGCVVSAIGIAWIAVRFLAWRATRTSIIATAGLATVALVLLMALGIPWLTLTRLSTHSVQWTQPASALWVNAVEDSDRIALQTAAQVDMYDRASGDLLWSATNADGVTSLAMGADGSLLASNQDHSTYYTADGTRLWERATYRRADNPATLPPPLAIANGIVVVGDCPRTSAASRPCAFAGIGRTGEIAWERSGYAIHSSSPSITNVDERPGTIPGVVVIREDAGADSAVITLAASDGHEIDRRKTTGPIVIAGDIVVFSDVVGSSCTMTGVRAGAEEWTTEGVPCASHPLVFEHRLYAYLADSGGTFTVDMRDGSWRESGALALWRGDDDRDATVGVPGNDVIVYRDRQHLTGIDADTGQELWTFTVTGDRVPGVEIGHGGVVVLARPGGHNPLMSAGTRRNGTIVTVLDAGSGAETGRFLHEDGSVWDSLPVGPGQAIVFTDTDSMRLVGRP